MPIILQSIPCRFGEEISVLISEINEKGYKIKNLPTLTYDFPILIQVGLDMATNILIVMDLGIDYYGSGIGCGIATFSLENEESMSKLGYVSGSGICNAYSLGSGGGGSGGGGETPGNDLLLTGLIFAQEDYPFLRTIAALLDSSESKIIFYFLGDSSSRTQAEIDEDLIYLKDRYVLSAPTYLHVFNIGNQAATLNYAWPKSPIEGSGWTWGNYPQGADFFSLMSSRLSSISQNQKYLGFSIPQLLKSFDLQKLVGDKPFAAKIYGLEWDYLQELRADESNFLIDNAIIPNPLYSNLVFEYFSSFPLNVTHLCEGDCCPPDCCVIRYRDTYCCVPRR